MQLTHLSDSVKETIKAAIKAKLGELGVQIDNELPDYVMVLVVNRKTQQQMDEDLALFLGDSTVLFTTWLHGVIKKLELASVSTKASKKKHSDVKTRPVVDLGSLKKIKTELLGSSETPLSSVKIKEEDFSSHSENVKSRLAESKENKVPESVSQDDDRSDWKISTKTADAVKQKERIKIVWDDKNDGDDGRKSTEESNTPPRPPPVSRTTLEMSKSHDKKSTKSRRGSGDEEERERVKSPRRRRRRDIDGSREKSGGDIVDARDILRKRKIEKNFPGGGSGGVDDDEDDSLPKKKCPTTSRSSKDTKGRQLPSVLTAIVRPPPEKQPSLPSLVKVTPRPVRPASMQPNCNLILKAVAEAEKSVAKAKMNSKIKEDFDEDKRPDKRTRPVKEMISVTLLNDRISVSKPRVGANDPPILSQVKEPLQTKLDEEEQLAEEDTMSMAIDGDDYMDSLDFEPQPRYDDVISKERRDNLEKKRRFIITLDSTASDNEIDNDLDGSPYRLEHLPESEEMVDKSTDVRSRLGPKVNDDLALDSDFILGDKDSLEFQGQAKCKFWPNCEAGETCSFHHPSSTCRVFPYCPYGDKCLYIHPACKFADKCLNSKCPYSHQVVTAPSKALSGQKCLFYPNCTKQFCPFLHVKKPCRFGLSCTKLGCEFEHFWPNSSRNPYKWVAK